MNSKILRNYAYVAQAAGLQVDPESAVLYGQCSGFTVTAAAANPSYPYMMTVTLSAAGGTPLARETLNAFAKTNKATTASLTQNGPLFTLRLKNLAKPALLQNALVQTLSALIALLQANGYQNCCCTCGRTDVATDAYYVSGNCLPLCPACCANLQQNQEAAMLQNQQKAENTIGGIVGALLGSLLGVACILLLSSLNFVAALSGIVMAVCTLKGYELLGGKLSRRGVIISVILMVIMTFVADMADWAIRITQSFDGVDFFTGFRAVPLLLAEGAISLPSYLGNLLLLFLFAALGAVPTIRGALINQKNTGRFYRFGMSSATGAENLPVGAVASVPAAQPYIPPAAPVAAKPVSEAPTDQPQV